MNIDVGFGSALVTGGAGFIGSHLADALIEEEVDVTVYDDLSAGNPDHIPQEASVLEADVRNSERLEEAVKEADVVFHEAAQVSVTKSVENPITSHETNIDPILTILEAARTHDTKIIAASSAAIYGHPEYTPVDEAHPKQPTNPYGLEKLTLDHYCRLYHDLYDTPTVTLRYFNVYGPRQRGGPYSGVISIFRDQATQNDPLTVEGDGSQTRDFVHVEDVVQANLLAATKPEAIGNQYNVGTGTETSILDLAHTITSILDTTSEITHVDPREGDIDQSVADITNIQSDLDYTPTYDIETGLEAYLDTQ